MPTYEYACTSCEEHTEVVQSFSDDPLTICPSCGGPLRKVFGTIGIVLKGSGFYKTDSRGAPPSEKAAGDRADSRPGGEGAAEGGSAKEPAAVSASSAGSGDSGGAGASGGSGSGGSGSTGSGANGSGTNGSGANGSGANGSGSKGSGSKGSGSDKGTAKSGAGAAAP